MTEFERDVIDRLGRIETKLDSDYRALHGNGKPGLIDRVASVEQRLLVTEIQEKEIQRLVQTILEIKSELLLLKERRKWWKDWLGWICAGGLTAKEAVMIIIKAMGGEQ